MEIDKNYFSIITGYPPLIIKLMLSSGVIEALEVFAFLVFEFST